MSIIRKGATKQYSDGWDAIFGGKGSKKKSAVTAKPKKSPKAAPKKKATKKKRK